jgi:hypothetical protein
MTPRSASPVLTLSLSAWACTDTPGTDALCQPLRRGRRRPRPGSSGERRRVGARQQGGEAEGLVHGEAHHRMKGARSRDWAGNDRPFGYVRIRK